MILSKKAKTEIENEANKAILRKHNSEVLSQPKTIGVLILEDMDFYNYTELDMETATVIMMNRAECSFAISNRAKSKMKEANGLVVYGEYDGIIFNGRPKNHWFKK